MRIAAICAGLLAVAAACGAQAPPGGLPELLRAQKPHRVRDLDASWFQASITLADPARHQVASVGLYYTQGRTAVVGGRTMLVAYAPNPPPPDFASVASGGQSAQEAGLDFAVPKLTPETPLSLTLLDTADIVSIEGPRAFAFAPQRVVRPAMNQVATGETAILAAVLYPVYANAREKARQTASLSNLKQLGLAAMQYCQDYDEVLPPMRSLTAAKWATIPYARSMELYVQPGTGKPYATNPAASHKPLAAIEYPAQFVLFYESEPARDGKRAVVFADGHAARIAESVWLQRKKKSGMR